MKAQTSERDLRFDFFRGIALLCICVNHIEGGIKQKTLGFLTLNTTGLYDNAMTFVFISGLMYGYVYEKLYLNHGLFMTWARSIVRAAQIYVFENFLLAPVLGVASLYLILTNDFDLVAFLNLGPYLNGDFLYFFKFVSFSHFPFFFDILPLYILLLIIMPIALHGMNHKPILTIIVSFLIYVASGFLAYYGFGKYLPLYNGTFILTLWQFLFLAGMYLGIKKRLGTLRVNYSKKYLYAAIVWLLIVFLNEKVLFLVNDFVIEINPSFLHRIPFTARRYLTPLRLFHFFVLVYVVSYFVTKNSRLFQNIVSRAIITCGQQSLEVFSFGVFLSFCGVFLIKYFNGGYIFIIFVDIIMVLLSVAFAYYLKWRKREPWRKAPKAI